MTEPRVLVIGGTGNLGGRVVEALVARGHPVRALVRDGTDPALARARGAEPVPGNLLDPASLRSALEGAKAVVTTAIGYLNRRKGDTLATVDDQGNRNLADAAREVGTPLVVFTSILAADVATEVPHFHQKAVIERYLADLEVPYVALRPGAFLGAPDMWRSGLAKGVLRHLGRAGVRWTYVHPDDVAQVVAAAVDEPRAIGGHIDIGTDRVLDAPELAAAFGQLMGRPVRLQAIPYRPVRALMGVGGLVRPMVADFGHMIDFFFSGRYIADTSRQAELFGPVPTIEDALRRYLREAGLPVVDQSRRGGTGPATKKVQTPQG